MFPSTDTPPTTAPAARLVKALRLIRSFLLLEDDYEVDWEVDCSERANRRRRDGGGRPRPDGFRTGASPGREHPHREPLRRAREERRRRRAGAVAGPDHACLCASSDGGPSVDRVASVARSEPRRRTERGDRTSLEWRG